MVTARPPGFPSMTSHSPMCTAGPRLEAEVSDTFGDLVRAVDGARRPDEAGEEAVAGRVVLGAAPVASASRTTE